MNEEKREGLSSDCKLDPTLVMVIMITPGNEHPCDGCNHNRNECRGFPKRSRDLGGMYYEN